MSSSTLIDSIVGKFPVLFGDTANLLILGVLISILFFLFNVLKKIIKEYIEKKIEQIPAEHKENSVEITRRFAPPLIFIILLVLFLTLQKWITAGLIVMAVLFYYIFRNRIPKLSSVKFGLIFLVILMILAYAADLATYDYRLVKNDRDFTVIFILPPIGEPTSLTRYETFLKEWTALKQSVLGPDKKIKIFPDPHPISFDKFTSKYSLNQQENIILYGIKKLNPIDIIVLCQWLTSDENRDYFRIRPLRIKFKPGLLNSFSHWEAPEGMESCQGTFEDIVDFAKFFLIEKKPVGKSAQEPQKTPECSIPRLTEKNIKKGFEKDLNTLASPYVE